MCSASRQILTSADNAARAIVSFSEMDLLLPSGVTGPGPPPAVAPARNPHTLGLKGPPAATATGKRARPPEPATVPKSGTPGAPLKVSVDGDEVTTKKRKYSLAALETLFGHPKKHLGLEFLRGMGGRAPGGGPYPGTPNAEGHGPGGVCRDLCGQDPSSPAARTGQVLRPRPGSKEALGRDCPGNANQPFLFNSSRFDAPARWSRRPSRRRCRSSA
jgi:hypothetical protein